MFLSKLKIAVVAFLVIGTLAIGISAQTRRTLAADSPPAASKSAPPSQEEGEPDKAGKLAGEWFYDSKVDQPCAISQHGRVLLLVNEEGELLEARRKVLHPLVQLHKSPSLFRLLSAEPRRTAPYNKNLELNTKKQRAVE